MLTTHKKTRPRSIYRLTLGLAGLFLLIFWPHSAMAKERVKRHYDETSGLTVSTVHALAQDDSGFLWIGTSGGLVRFDGIQMRPWAKETLTGTINLLLSGRDGEILARDDQLALYQVVADGVSPVIGPEARPLDNVTDAVFNSDRTRLWVTGKGYLMIRDADHKWAFASIGVLGNEQIRQLRPGPDDSIFLLTRNAIWQLDSDRNIRKIFDYTLVMDILLHPDGAFYVLAWNPNGDGEVLELREGRATLRLRVKNARPIDLALRGRVVWASFDRYLAALRPKEQPEILGPDDGIASGGPLIVDREGSLWLGTFRGLVQYPEPATLAFNDRDGLPSAHARFLARAESGIWVSTWQGLGRLDKAQGRWRVHNQHLDHKSPLCVDGDGALWIHVFAGDSLRYLNGQFIKQSLPQYKFLYSCCPEADKTMWLATDHGLLRAGADDSRHVSIGADKFESIIETVFRDSHARLWVCADNRVCSASVAAIDSGPEASWSCQTLEGVNRVTDIVELQSGSLWASTHNAGVWRYGGKGWEVIPASHDLPSGRIWGLVLSPAGGVWVLGDGVCIRVKERPDLDSGWEIVERLGSWQGFPVGGAEDLIEESNGDLWITTTSGVVYMPAEARRAGAQSPSVKLVDLILNGRRVELNQTPQIPSGHNQLEIHFAALSYRDRSLLRYQYRLHPDAAWTDSFSREPLFRFVDLSPGKYAAEVRASLDGIHWSATSARLAFEVLGPWYLKWWVLALFSLALGAALYAAYRARLTFLLRLERQRARIAIDLHDELGSGLGSIGILSKVVTDEGLTEAERISLARKIAETSRELGTSLTDIVWALQPGSNDLESLAYHLIEHAERLFPGKQAIFSMDVPDIWPKVNLSLAKRRNLQLIALEALHNAARHSAASRVVFGLKPTGRNWQMWIADDGTGLMKTLSEGRRGMGLLSMKRRAEEIGADISWMSEDGKGTTVKVIFHPH